jgi:hypothetical protein
MTNVEPPIMIRVTRKAYLRPTRSPMRPKKSAPKGRAAKPAAKVARVERTARV